MLLSSTARLWCADCPATSCFATFSLRAFISLTSLACSLLLASAAPFNDSSQAARCALRSARSCSTDAAAASAALEESSENVSALVTQCFSLAPTSSSFFPMSTSTTSRACNFSPMASCASDLVSSSLFKALVNIVRCSRACSSSRRKRSMLSSVCWLMRSSAIFQEASKPAVPATASWRVCCISCFKFWDRELNSALSWTASASSSPARSRRTDVSPSCRLELSLQRRSLRTALSC
mmetsp:Transcript_48555/g.89442  ORF Transcript_48555/g.89442 Transcript_48555/m.89442 type:complete len:237 (-) Transcript_48555:420-1130(-)